MAKDREVRVVRPTATHAEAKHFLSLNIIIYSFTYNTSHSFPASVAYGTGVDITTKGQRTVNYLFFGVHEYQNRRVELCLHGE